MTASGGVGKDTSVRIVVVLERSMPRRFILMIKQLFPLSNNVLLLLSNGIHEWKPMTRFNFNKIAIPHLSDEYDRSSSHIADSYLQVHTDIRQTLLPLE